MPRMHLENNCLVIEGNLLNNIFLLKSCEHVVFLIIGNLIELYRFFLCFYDNSIRFGNFSDGEEILFFILAPRKIFFYSKIEKT